MLTQYDTMQLNELTAAIEDLNVLQNVVWCYNRLFIGARYAKNFILAYEKNLEDIRRSVGAVNHKCLPCGYNFQIDRIEKEENTNDCYIVYVYIEELPCHC